MEFVPHVIDGQETESIAGERFASVDPWTREPWAEVALGGADALASQEHWKKVRSFLDSIEPDGGTIRTGGPGEGWVVLPTIVENAPPTARVCRQGRDGLGQLLLHPRPARPLRRRR